MNNEMENTCVSEKMRCRTCMWYVKKEGTVNVGRCRKHCPTISGYPVAYQTEYKETDWCGDHKLDETK